VIDSSEIGIIGAGEGTTPPVTDFLRDLGIRPSELIRHCQASLKLGIRFEGWHQDARSSYYHAFAEKDQWWFYQDVASNSGRPLFAFDDALNHSHNRLLDFCMDNHCSNMVPDLEDDFANQDPAARFRALSAYAMHFDTFMLNRFLRYQGTALHNIYRVDGVIQSCELNEQSDITALLLKNGDKIGCDFVIDCTGLRRMLISSWQKNDWVSYKHMLPVDRAVGFQQAPADNLDCYTTARAMPAGWCWTIPIQTARRCGYVYSSQHLSDDAAPAAGDPAQVGR
jgi:tryptophan halogenase